MNFLKDSNTPENAPISNSLLYEISIDGNLDHQGIKQLEHVIRIQTDIDNIRKYLVYNDAFAKAVDVEISRFSAELRQVTVPYFKLAKQIKNNLLMEKSLNELSKNLRVLIQSQNNLLKDCIIEETSYFFERLSVEIEFKTFLTDLIKNMKKDIRENFKDIRKNKDTRKNFSAAVTVARLRKQLRNVKAVEGKNSDKEIKEEPQNKKSRKQIKQDKISHAKNMAEEHCKDYKNGLISYGELKSKLEIMQLKGRLNQDYIDNLLEAFKED